MGDKRITIQEPYWGAWKKYGWAKGIWGVGVNARVIDDAVLFNKTIILHVKYLGDSFRIKASTIQKYAKDNNCIYEAKKGVRLYMIPQTLLKRKDDAQG